MDLLDAYALIAYVIGGPAQEMVRSILREGKTAVATANLVQVFDVAERVHSLPISRVSDVIEGLFATTLSVVHLDERLAQRAGELRVEHYHRSRSPLSLADVILLASASSGRPHRDGRPGRAGDRRGARQRDRCAAGPG